jgi:hypothetical protein
MITTLRTGALTLLSVQYRFDANKRLTIKLTSDGEHKLYGDVNITLANVADINIYDNQGNLIEDFFNNTFLFSRTGEDTLEYSENINSGVAQTEASATLADDGDDITATVANSSFDLPAGTYNFLLLDTANSAFSSSAIAIKQLNVGGTGVDGIESVYYEEDDFIADPKEFSINNLDLVFNFAARVSIKDNNAGVTNIPLIIS